MINTLKIPFILKGPYHDQPSFYMLKYSFCLVPRHICCPNWIFDSPTIKQKLEFLAQVWHVKVAIQNNKWHKKVAIWNNKWHAKQAIQNIVLDTQFCMPLIVPDSQFCVPLIVPDSHFCVPHQCEEFQFFLDCGTIKDPIRTTNMSLNSAK